MAFNAYDRNRLSDFTMKNNSLSYMSSADTLWVDLRGLFQSEGLSYGNVFHNSFKACILIPIPSLKGSKLQQPSVATPWVA
jgi:hypothetical protein